MATKNNPGDYDCYAHAEPDEPMFVLLARDPLAEYLTAVWVALRAGDVTAAHDLLTKASLELIKTGKRLLLYNDLKSVEAQQCSYAMRTWRIGKQVDEAEKRLSNG